MYLDFCFKMDLNTIRKNILDLKEHILEALNSNETCEQYLRDGLDKSPEQMSTEQLDLWHFAFKNASNWAIVIEEFSKYIENSDDDDDETESEYCAFKDEESEELTNRDNTGKKETIPLQLSPNPNLDENNNIRITFFEDKNSNESNEKSHNPNTIKAGALTKVPQQQTILYEVLVEAKIVIEFMTKQVYGN